MTHRIYRPISLVFASAALSGCAGLGQVTNNIWSETKFAASKTKASFSEALRPAPTQTLVFDTGDAALNTKLLMRKFAHNSAQPVPTEEARLRFNPPMDDRMRPSEIAAPELRGLQPVSRYNAGDELGLAGGRYAQSTGYENGVKVYRPFAQPAPRPIMMRPSPAMTRPSNIDVKPQPVPEYIFEGPLPTYDAPAPASTSPHSDEYSYVKMGGGSDIADWQACEAMAGGFVTYDMSGYSIDPAFDSCMRERGYKPESEAEIELAGP